MTILTERLLPDTNVWIFGLCRDDQFPACAELLEGIGALLVVIPRQVLKELNANLTLDEMQDFYQLVNRHPERIELSWDLASIEKVKFYQERGCKKGDAVIAAHAEALMVTFLITENRQFLQSVEDLPFEIMTPTEFLARFEPQLPDPYPRSENLTED